MLVVGEFLLENGVSAVGVAQTALFHGLEMGVLHIHVVALYLGQKRTFVFQIVDVHLDGAFGNRGDALFFQMLVHNPVDVGYGIIVVVVGQKLVDEKITGYGVFVRWHEVVCFWKCKDTIFFGKRTTGFIHGKPKKAA